jgi:hypothetical protein
MALVGTVLTLLVPVARRHRDLNPIRIEPSGTAPATAAGSAPTGTSGE